MEERKYRLPKRRVLRQNKEFQRAYRAGKTFADHYLVLYVTRREELTGKVGFAAGKKLGNAVTRNRVKRLLRESYRLHQHEIEEGVCLLLVGRAALTKAKCRVAERSFRNLLKKAGIYKKKEQGKKP